MLYGKADCASSVSFDTSVDLDVGGVVVSASALNAAINTGATKSIVIVAAVGQTFGTEHPLTIGGSSFFFFHCYTLVLKNQSTVENWPWSIP